MNRYEHMTDSEFINLLELKLNDKNWNVGEMVELERRGISIVKQKKVLSDALLKKRSEFTDAFNEALKPYAKQFEILSDSIISFKNLNLKNTIAMNPKIKDQVILSPKIAQDLVLQEVANILGLSLNELRGIRQQSKRDWFQWGIFISSAVGGVITVISFILTQIF